MRRRTLALVAVGLLVASTAPVWTAPAGGCAPSPAAALAPGQVADSNASVLAHGDHRTPSAIAEDGRVYLVSYNRSTRGTNSIDLHVSDGPAGRAFETVGEVVVPADLADTRFARLSDPDLVRAGDGYRIYFAVDDGHGHGKGDELWVATTDRLNASGWTLRPTSVDRSTPVGAAAVSQPDVRYQPDADGPDYWMRYSGRAANGTVFAVFATSEDGFGWTTQTAVTGAPGSNGEWIDAGGRTYFLGVDAHNLSLYAPADDGDFANWSTVHRVREGSGGDGQPAVVWNGSHYIGYYRSGPRAGPFDVHRFVGTPPCAAGGA